jgi:hypothetical protein
MEFNFTLDQAHLLLELVSERVKKYDKNTRDGQTALAPLIPLKAVLEQKISETRRLKLAMEWKELVG